MKKYAVLAPLILSIVVNSSYAALTGATIFDVNVPSLLGGPSFGITSLYFQTTTPHNDYVLTFPPDNSGSFALDGKFHSVDPDNRWNFKLDLGYIFPCSGNELMLSYFVYNQHTDDFVTIDTFNAEIVPSLSSRWPTTGFVTVPTPNLRSSVNLFFPGITLDLTSSPLFVNPNVAVAKSTINHHAFDLDYGQYINLGCLTRIKYFTGLRFVSTNNAFDAVYNYSAVDPEIESLVDPVTGLTYDVQLAADFTETTHQSTDFEGVGPLFGLDLNHHLLWGFGLVGNITTSLLVGRIETKWDEKFVHVNSAFVLGSNIASIPAGTVFSHFSEERNNFAYPKEYRVVPNIDAKIGIDWSYQFCNVYRTKLKIEAGYMACHYFNVVDRVADFIPVTNNRNTVDEYFNGFFVGFHIDT